MAELGTVVEIVQAVNSIGRLNKEVGNMVNGIGGKKNHNGHGKGFPGATRVIARGNAGAEADTDLSDLYEESPGKGQSAAKAPACYQSVMEHMAELNALQSSVGYHARLKESRPLQLLESAKQAAQTATAHGMMSVFRGIAPEPVQPLDEIVAREIEVMMAMQRQVSMAVHHSGGIVKKLAAYDEETLLEFEDARKTIGTLERKHARIGREKATLEGQLGQTPRDGPAYVPMQIQIDSLERSEKDIANKLELAGQQLLYADKQSAQIKTKEAVVRAGLHELRLVNSYVTRFLSFVQRTRPADELIPQLVQTAEAISSSYEVLRGIVDAGNASTTQAVERLAQAIGTVNYTVLPNTITAGRKQQSILERMDRKTSFYEQAVKLLRSDADAGMEGQPAAAAPPIASALN